MNHTIREDYFKIVNLKVRRQCKQEILETTGVKPTTFNAWLSRGISDKSPVLDAVRSIIEKFIKSEN